jgi:hypothetical protein
MEDRLRSFGNDAQKWAEAFCASVGQGPIDQGAMIFWFRLAFDISRQIERRARQSEGNYQALIGHDWHVSSSGILCLGASGIEIHHGRPFRSFLHGRALAESYDLEQLKAECVGYIRDLQEFEMV